MNTGDLFLLLAGKGRLGPRSPTLYIYTTAWSCNLLVYTLDKQNREHSCSSSVNRCLARNRWRGACQSPWWLSLSCWNWAASSPWWWAESCSQDLRATTCEQSVSFAHYSSAFQWVWLRLILECDYWGVFHIRFHLVHLESCLNPKLHQTVVLSANTVHWADQRADAAHWNVIHQGRFRVLYFVDLNFKHDYKCT